MDQNQYEKQSEEMTPETPEKEAEAVTESKESAAPEKTPAPAPQKPEKKKASGVALASFICGVVGVLFNPFYGVSLAAIILGIVGIATAKDRPKGMAIAGLIIGCVVLPVQLVLDIILSMFTFGLSFCF